MSLIYPLDGIDGYPRKAFPADLVREAAAAIRGALEDGAHGVQTDFTVAGPRIAAASGCPDRTLIWNLPRLRRVLPACERHRNDHRPHMALFSAATLKRQAQLS